MEQKYRRKLIAQICVSLLLLIFLFVQIKPSQLRDVFGTISVPDAMGIAGLLIPSILIRGFRWRFLFEDGSYKISISESVQLLFVGLSLNLFLPAGSGDIAKSYYGYKWSGVKERMLSVSIMDKLIALGSIALLGIPFGLYRNDILYVMLSLLVLITVLFLMAISRFCPQYKGFHGSLEKLTQWTRKKIDFSTVLEQSQTSFRKLYWATVLSVLGWLITYFQMYCCFHVVNADVNITFVLTAAPLITLARLFPFALSGLGSDEMALFYIFQTQGLNLEQILAAAILFRFIVIILPGMPGLWILSTKRRFQSVIDSGRTGVCK